MITDVHAHVMPSGYAATLPALSGGAPKQGMVSPSGPLSGLFAAMGDSADAVEQRLEMMDDAGVGVQVLSPPGIAPYSTDRSAAVDAAVACNDTTNDLVRSHPDRFAGFVSLPLPHIDESLAEIERGLDVLGMVGVTMSCSVFNRSVAEDEFEPLYEEMNRRGATLFFHPCQNGICSPMINDYGFTVAVGASLEDTVIVLHLIKKNIPSRYPNIKMIVPHLGGLIPMQLERLDGQAHTEDLAEAPSVTARRLYYDTVGWGSQAALKCAAMAFGADHLVAGSDFPFLLTAESYRQTFGYIRESELPPDDIHVILEENGAELIGRANHVR